MPFCPFLGTPLASRSESPRLCYECCLSPSFRADARGVLLREKFCRAQPRCPTAKSLRKSWCPRKEKKLLSGIWLPACPTLAHAVSTSNRKCPATSGGQTVNTKPPLALVGDGFSLSAHVMPT